MTPLAVAQAGDASRSSPSQEGCARCPYQVPIKVIKVSIKQGNSQGVSLIVKECMDGECMTGVWCPTPVSQSFNHPVQKGIR